MKLHYRGDCTDYDPTEYVGPDIDGGFYRPVSAEYDAGTGCTAITFVPIPPADWKPEMMLVRSKQMSNRERAKFVEAHLNPSRRIFTDGITVARPAEQGADVRDSSRSPRKPRRKRH